MTEYINVRASEMLDQGELVAFLKSRFGRRTKQIGRQVLKGTECVEVSVLSNSADFDEICRFVGAKRAQGAEGFPNLQSAGTLGNIPSKNYGRQKLSCSRSIHILSLAAKNVERFMRPYVIIAIGAVNFPIWLSICVQYPNTKTYIALLPW